MVSTCSYKNYNSNLYKTIAISGNRGKDANYTGECFPKLAPKLSFWKVWHDNTGIILEEENTKYYIEQYYNQVLSRLDPEEIYREIDGSILLCYEDSYEFCHRHIVAAWFEILLGVHVPEIKVQDDFIEEVDRPEYIKTYLEDIMRKNKNMKEEETGKCYDSYRQIPCYLKSDVDNTEPQYAKSKHLKVKK